MSNASWRPASSSSSRLTPLRSLRRSTARPAMARPCASIGRPASVVSVIANASPCARSASTASSIARALPASSQLPKASTRCGAEAPTMRGIAFDDRLIRRRRPVDQNLRLGLQQRIGAVEVGAQCRDRRHGPQLPGRAARTARPQQHDRGNDGKARGARAMRTSAAISCRSMLREALTTTSRRASTGASSARAGAAATTPMAARIPRCHGRAQPRLVRIVSGMPLCPLLAATAIKPAGRG